MTEEPSETVVVIYSHTHVHTGFTLATVPCSHPQPPHVWARAHTHPYPSPESGFHTHTPAPLQSQASPPLAPLPPEEACSEQCGGGRLRGPKWVGREEAAALGWGSFNRLD